MRSTSRTDEELQEKFWSIQANRKSILFKIFVALEQIWLANYFYGIEFAAALTSVLIGYKLADQQGYGFRDWELYVTSLLWPVLVVADLIRRLVK